MRTIIRRFRFRCFCSCAGCVTGKGHCYSVTCGGG